MVTHVGLNDDVVEGLRRSTCRRSRVQYHPEAAAGPHDAAYLFDRFVDLMSAHGLRRGRLMPRRTDISSVLVIGSGPIVIGQACEFDYSGTQACRVLREEGLRVVLVNSNPATIMTDPEFADATYVEPITTEVVATIIAKERPDALLPTLGGQTALNAAIALDEAGVLEKYGVELIGANIAAIQKGEDRQQFKERRRRVAAARRALAQRRSATRWTSASRRPTSSATRWSCGRRSRWAASARASPTTRTTCAASPAQGLHYSPTTEVLLEESILGWKEYELELMRDRHDNVVVVCSIENVDPVGVHTGDSVTVAPALTLTDREYQRLRDIGIAVIREVGVDTGGCNIQFAINPADGRIVVIEMNPRVSRSSALASKATGFPIAKIAAKLAVGYTLDEIPNDITAVDAGQLRAHARLRRRQGPAVRVREVPRRRRHADDDHEVRRRGDGARPQLHRGARQGPALAGQGRRAVPLGRRRARRATPSTRSSRRSRGRPRTAWSACSRRCAAGAPGAEPMLERVFEATAIDPWFLDQIQLDQRGRGRASAPPDVLDAPGCCARQAARPLRRADRPAARHAARTPSAASGTPSASARSTRPSTPAPPSSRPARRTTTRPTTRRPRSRPRDRPQGRSSSAPGPTASARASSSTTPACTPRWRSRSEYETVMVNCNPETVSTDYDTSDRLYFEPLTLRGRAGGLPRRARGRPVEGVIVQLGGQTPLGLAQRLADAGRADPRHHRPRRSTPPRTAASSARCSPAPGLPAPRLRHRDHARRGHARSPTDRLPGAGAPVVRARRPRHGDRLRRADARRTTSARGAPQISTASTRCSSTGSSTTRSRSTSTRCSTARRCSSAASWSTSRRPASTPATRPACCRR